MLVFVLIHQSPQQALDDGLLAQVGILKQRSESPSRVTVRSILHTYFRNQYKVLIIPRILSNYIIKYLLCV